MDFLLNCWTKSELASLTRIESRGTSPNTRLANMREWPQFSEQRPTSFCPGQTRWSLGYV
jgi:hypothetical protein